MTSHLIELAPQRFASVAPLFGELEHSIAIVHAVLEGNSPGRILVDTIPTPTLALLYAVDAFCYLAGDAESRSLAGIEETLYQGLLPGIADSELVIFSASEALRNRLDDLLAHRRVIRIERCVFRFDVGRHAALVPWRLAVPPGMRLVPIDKALAIRYPEYEPLVDPATRRYGVCLMQAGEVVSACSAVYVGGGHAEAAVHTMEAYRGRGYASLVARAFAEETLARGLTPAWSCWPDRLASRAIALSTGFVELAPAIAHYWAPDL